MEVKLNAPDLHSYSISEHLEFNKKVAHNMRQAWGSDENIGRRERIRINQNIK
ncbi:MAG: hypothetical protein LBF59_06035 [Prevotellaceae bacterium]|jgi:hypothetical protein|nr:hypothetical protein [Prevotellaceae bacterium]